MDDGGGCLAAWEAARLIMKAGLKPRRTIRVVLWTNEENGLGGAKEYARRHAADLKNTCWRLNRTQAWSSRRAMASLEVARA
jgi:carboxypeptidase Q